MSRAGIIRAEGEVVSSVSSDSLVVVQIPPSETDSGQFEPRQITVGDLISGGGTDFTSGSVIFAGTNGDLDEDHADLNYNSGTSLLTATNITVPTLLTAQGINIPAGGTLSADSISLSFLKYVDVAVTAAVLDGAGNQVVVTAGTGDRFKIREIILVGGGTNFGAGGNRNIILTDGTTTYTTIANADIEAAPAASLRWGDTKVPFSGGTSNTATVAGQNLRFTYSGGTTDHTTGSITFSVGLEKVV